MKTKLVAMICLILGITTTLNAQNEIDALRYSRHMPSGTARYLGLGGAFAALGGDFTTLSHNPAGIGIYKSSEVSITPSLFFGSTESTYMGNINEDSKYNFNLGNVGVVMVNDLTLRNPESAWKNIQFGIGLNRLANFNNRVIVDGFNESSSYLTPIVRASQGVQLDDLDNFGAGLAYDVDLMYLNSLGEYVIDMENGGVNQRKTMESSGSINEMVFAFGGNLNDRLYLGAAIGVPYVKYRETSIYTEADVEDRNDYFNSFTRTDELETSGSGVNFKMGAIVRATDFLRLGASIETPTFYADLSDTYSTSFRATFDTVASKRATSDGFFEYSLTTPLKATGGIGFIVGKAGLISADYEYMDYSKARLRSPDYDFVTENEAIQDGYLIAHNIRLGTEWRFGNFNVRGGYAIMANPYRFGTESVMSSYSAGFGIRERNFFIDFAWVMNQMDDEYHLYNAPANTDPAIAETKYNANMFLLTLGIKY